MFITIVIAALVVDALFSAFNLIPQTRPSAEDVFGEIEVNYKLALNALATIAFVALLWLTIRRGATDPVCGMKVDRSKALKLESEGRSPSISAQSIAAHSSRRSPESECVARRPAGPRRDGGRRP